MPLARWKDLVMDVNGVAAAGAFPGRVLGRQMVAGDSPSVT